MLKRNLINTTNLGHKHDFFTNMHDALCLHRSTEQYLLVEPGTVQITYSSGLSFDSRYRQPDDRSTDAEKQSKSTGDRIAAFLVLSKKPIRSSMTITWPSFVFSSLTDLISNHCGRSFRVNKPKKLDLCGVFSSANDFALSRLLMKSSYRPIPKTNITVPKRYTSRASTSENITFPRFTKYSWNEATTYVQPLMKQRRDPTKDPQTARIAKKRQPYITFSTFASICSIFFCELRSTPGLNSDVTPGDELCAYVGVQKFDLVRKGTENLTLRRLEGGTHVIFWLEFGVLVEKGTVAVVAKALAGLIFLRGAKIYAELRGYGMSGDAYHITQPHADGRGAILAMTHALEQSGLHPKQVDYINAHATSTPLGDAVEANAIKSVFSTHATSGSLALSSTKGAIGHLLGAAGAVEAIFTVLSIHHGIAPLTLNLTEPDPVFSDDFMPLADSREMTIKAAMSNSFGFGGTNSSLLFASIS